MRKVFFLPSRFQAYSVYKASGVGWLGDVPGDWEVRRPGDVVNADGVKAGCAIGFLRCGGSHCRRRRRFRN